MRASRLETFVLAAGLSIPGPLAAAASGTALYSLGVPESLWPAVCLVVFVLAGWGAGLAAPRVFTIAPHFDRVRRVGAGLIAPPLASLTGVFMRDLGADGEVVNYEHSPWALLKEATGMGILFGTMFLVAYLILRTGAEGRSE